MGDATGKKSCRDYEEVLYTYLAELLCDSSFGTWHRFSFFTRAARSQEPKDHSQVYQIMHTSISPDQSSDRQDTDRIPKENFIGQIARDHAEEYIKIYKPPLHQIKFLRAIRICKSPALGGKVIICKKCNKEHYIYFSCGHSRCSICQSIKREQWMDKMGKELLAVPYVHLVTTMPHDFNGLARRNPKQMYNLLFRATAKTVKELSKNDAHLGANSGLISILHTFGSDMKYHIHIHSLMTFGGIDSEGDWRFPNHKKRICRNSKLRATFKRIFLEGLRELFNEGLLEYHTGYDQAVEKVKDKAWTVFVTHPTMQTKTIELYLARYINRIAVTNSRLNYIKENKDVHLLYNDYRNQEQDQVAPKLTRRMSPLVFLGQLLEHLPPKYFQRTRRYGIHASAKSKLVKRTIEGSLKRHGRTIRTVMEIISHLMGLNPFECVECGSKEFTVKQVLPNKEWVHQWITVPRIRAPDTRIKISHSPSAPIF